MMKSLAVAAVVLAVCSGSPLWAQSPTPEESPETATSNGEETWANPITQPPTVEPRDLVHQRAVAKEQQRQNRIAARKWFGYSNARPTVSPTPWAGGYSPTWISNTARPFMWSGVGEYPTYGGYYYYW